LIYLIERTVGFKKAMAIKFSKKGDRGFTSLLGGKRVSKSGPRPEAYGTVDEASSALGMARAWAQRPGTREIILSIQKELVILGAELATESQDAPKFKHQVRSQNVDRLEQLMEELQKQVTLKKEFVYPGGSPAGAAIDLARTIIRRGERRAVGLLRQKKIHNPEVLRYFNRLADLLFVLARYEDDPSSPCTP
jgi:cob(I)alamin adenosyltransferase